MYHCGTRSDGGPTTWQAVIQPTDTSKSYREFLFEFADFQLAYQAGFGIGANGQPIADPVHVVNPPLKEEVGLPFIVENAMDCPGESRRPVRKQSRLRIQARSASTTGTSPCLSACEIQVPTLRPVVLLVICRRFISQTSPVPIRSSTCSPRSILR